MQRIRLFYGYLRQHYWAVWAVGAVFPFLLLGLLWVSLHNWAIEGLENVQSMRFVEVPARPESDIILGYAELGQNLGSASAEERHLLVTRDAQGALAFANLAKSRRILFVYETASLTDLNHILREGDSFRVNGADYGVMALNEGRLELQLPDETQLQLPSPYWVEPAGDGFRWLSSSATIGGRIAHNPTLWEDVDGPVGRIRTSLARYAAFALGEEAPPIVVAQRNLEPDAIRVRRVAGQYVISAGPSMPVRICPSAAPCFENGRGLWPYEHPELGKLRQLVVGRTTYSVSRDNAFLRLKPIARHHWLTTKTIDTYRQKAIRAATIVYSNPLTNTERGVSLADIGEDPFALVRTAPTSQAGVELLTLVFAAIAWSLLLRFKALSAAWLSAGALLVSMWPFAQAITPGMCSIAGLCHTEQTLAWLIVGTTIAVVSLQLVNFLPQPRSLFAGAPTHTRRFSWLVSRWRSNHLLAILTALLGPLAMDFLSPAQGVPSGQNTAREASLGPAVSAVILLFMLGGVSIASALRSATMLLFWGALMLIAMLGLSAQFKLTLGQEEARYLVLLERHVLALAVIAMAGVLISFVPTRRIMTFVKLLINFADRDWNVSWLELMLGWLPIIGSLVLAFLQIPVLMAENIVFPFAATPGGLLSEVWLPLTTSAIACVLFCIGLGTLFGAYAVRHRSVLPWILWYRVTIPSLWFLITSGTLGFLVLITPETGIFGFQPSELTKSWLAFLYALFVARQVQSRVWQLPFEKNRSWIGLFLILVAVSGLFMTGSAINFDLSPALIIMAMLSGILGISAIIWASISLAKQMALRNASWVPVVVFAVVIVGLLLWDIDIFLKIALILFALAAAPYLWRYVHSRSAHVTPWMMRTKMFFARRYYGRLKIVHLLTAFLLLGGGFVFSQAWVKQQFSILASEEALRDYNASFFGISIPRTPLERVLSYHDGSFHRLDDQTSDSALVVQYPDLSLQVRESREIIDVSGCGFSDRVADLPDMLEGLTRPPAMLVELAQRASRIIRNICPVEPDLFPLPGNVHPAIRDLPAVQDDFAPTLVLSTFGLDGALVLAAVQVVLIAAILHFAVSTLNQTYQSTSLRGLGLLSVVLLSNLCFVLTSQFVLSWGNILGLLPVVGQPMTFVSLGASHHLFFALPVVLATLVVGHVRKATLDKNTRKPERLFGQALRRRWSVV